MKVSIEEKINLFFRDKITIPIGRWLAKKGVSPNDLTSIGIVASIAAALLTAIFGLFVGAFAVFISSLPDLFDGSVARANNSSTKLGAVRDDVADRIGEFSYFGAILWLEDSFSIYIAVATSFLVSYLAASAKGQDYKISSGKVLGRPARIALLVLLMLISSWFEISFTIWAIVALNIFALFKRGLEIKKQSG